MENKYWISPDGEIIPVEEHPVKTMIKQPERFNYTIDEMQMLYAKYSDENEAEGEATKTIIHGLIEKGWSYCYRKGENREWQIEVYKLNKNTRFHLRSWAAFMIAKSCLSLDSHLKFHRFYQKDKLKKRVLQLIEDDLFS